MIYLIIGHRGVGKTLWLKKLKNIFKNRLELSANIKAPCFIDLDQEIEKKTKKKIKDFFSPKSLNKKYFRRLENKTLKDLIDKYKNAKFDVFISVGAGVQEGFAKHCKIFPLCNIIHLIRETDPKGRVFFNRPRLSANKSAYEEYMSFYSKREKFYRAIKTQSFVLPEQDFSFNTAEKLFFGLQKSSVSGIITLNKNSLPACKSHWPGFIKKRLSWGLSFFELRDDELSLKELKILLKMIPPKKQLLSFRKKGPSPFLNLTGVKTYDWPLEKGPPSAFPPVLSLHKRTACFATACKKLTRHKAGHFKLAVPVNNFKELMQGHLWFLEDPEHRSFLPRSLGSQTSCWRWYRQIFGPAMKLHFIKESRTKELDQVFLYEHLLAMSFRKRKNHAPVFFAAVLGHPVAHSKSPAFHRKFFAQKKMPFVKISMTEKEFTKETLCILQKMGLCFSAVTSPLKKKAFALCDVKDSFALKARAVNTLIFADAKTPKGSPLKKQKGLKKGKWLGSNTDGHGLKHLLRHLGLRNLTSLQMPESLSGASQKKMKHTAVWGGGGMESVLRAELPFADFYSARTARKKPCFTEKSPIVAIKAEEVRLQGKKAPSLAKKKGPDILIWAVGRNRMSSCVFPPRFWKPKQVIDLNYTEDSPGREYALLVGAKYLSGNIMFENQALKQQSLFLRQKINTTS